MDKKSRSLGFITCVALFFTVISMLAVGLALAAANDEERARKCSENEDIICAFLPHLCVLVFSVPMFMAGGTTVIGAVFMELQNEELGRDLIHFWLGLCTLCTCILMTWLLT